MRGREISRCERSLREWRVSSQAMRSAWRRVSMARRVMSPRFPIGVGTKMTWGGLGSGLDAIGEACDDGVGGAFEGVGQSVEACGLKVVVNEEAGVSTALAFVENDAGASAIDQAIGDRDLELEFLRAEDVDGGGADLPVLELLDGEDEGGVGFVAIGQPVGAVVDESIDCGISGDGFDAGKDDAAFGEGDVDGFNRLKMLGLVSTKTVACTGSEEAGGEDEEERAHLGIQELPSFLIHAWA